MLEKICIHACRGLLYVYLFFPLTAFPASHGSKASDALQEDLPKAVKQGEVFLSSVTSRNKSIEEFLRTLEERRYDFNRSWDRRATVVTRGIPAQAGERTTQFHENTSHIAIDFKDTQKKWEGAKKNLLSHDRKGLSGEVEDFCYDNSCLTKTKIQELYSWAKYSFILCYYAFYLGRFYESAEDSTVESVWNIVEQGSENFAILGRSTASQDDSQKQNFYFLMKDIFLYLYFPEKKNSFSINLKKAVEGVIDKLYYGPGNTQRSNTQSIPQSNLQLKKRVSIAPSKVDSRSCNQQQKQPIFGENIEQWLLKNDKRDLSSLDSILNESYFSCCDDLNNRPGVDVMKDKYPLGPQVQDKKGESCASEEAERRVYSLAMYSCLQLWRFAPDTCRVHCSTYKKADAKPKLDGKSCTIPKPPFTPSKTYVKVPEVKKPLNKLGGTKNKQPGGRCPNQRKKGKITPDEEEITEMEKNSILSRIKIGGGERGSEMSNNPSPQNSKKYSIKDSILIEIMCWDPNLRPKK